MSPVVEGHRSVAPDRAHWLIVIARSVNRTWAVVSWRLGTAGHDTDAAVDALDPLDVDVVALQWVRAREVRAIANHLDLPYVWARSHHPVSRLVPGSAIGVAVMTPHRIVSSTARPIGDETSLWSSRRRVMQAVGVTRKDHTGFTIVHGSGPLPSDADRAASGAPAILVDGATGPGMRPQVGVPDGATLLSSDHRRPIDGAAQLVVTRFEMTWVEGGFATG